MKLKELIGKDVEITIHTNIFDEDDIENVGPDYEVSDEDVRQRIKNMIENDELSLKYCDYKYIVNL